MFCEAGAWPRGRLLLLAVLALLLLGLALGRPLTTALLASKGWFLGLGLAGVVVHCVLFSLGAALLLPYAPFCISVGYIWGLPRGFLVQTLAIALSSAAIYAVGRCCLRARLLGRIETDYAEVKEVIDHVNSGWRAAVKINLVLCFVPMPYGCHAYIFSLSESPLLLFTPVFIVGMVFHTYFNLAVGAALASPPEVRGASHEPWYFWALVASALVAAGLICGCERRPLLAEAGDATEATEATEPGEPDDPEAGPAR